MSRIDLVQLSPAVLGALADGDLAAANAASSLVFSDYFVGLECRGVWRRRVAQILDDPPSAVWITRAILDRNQGVVVGRAGFHGPPDTAGMVEVGYAVDPAFRRQGFARAALAALLTWARDEPSVRTVRASVRPDNLASRSLIAAFGFVEVGEQWDDEDGLETVFEVPART